MRWILASGVLLPLVNARAQSTDGDPDFDPEFEPPAGASTPGRRTKLPRVDGHSVNLPLARDLHADGERSAREKIPVLLFFDLWDCPYCDRALREFLVPMAIGEEWRTRAIYRQVEIDRNDPVVDFAGGSTTHRALATSYKVKFTPTLHLLNARGEQLGTPVIGLMTPDFYGAYIEQAISEATRKLQTGA